MLRGLESRGNKFSHGSIKIFVKYNDSGIDIYNPTLDELLFSRENISITAAPGGDRMASLTAFCPRQLGRRPSIRA